MRIYFSVGAVLAAAVSICGCGEPQPSGDSTKSAQEPATTSSNTPAGGDSGSITPMAGVGAGPMAPVSGAESVQGGGSGVGNVMKDKAREVAGSSPSSLNQMGTDD